METEQTPVMEPETEDIQALHRENDELARQAADRAAVIAGLEETLAERDAELGSLQETVAELEARLADGAEILAAARAWNLRSCLAGS